MNVALAPDGRCSMNRRTPLPMVAPLLWAFASNCSCERTVSGSVTAHGLVLAQDQFVLLIPPGAAPIGAEIAMTTTPSGQTAVLEPDGFVYASQKSATLVYRFPTLASMGPAQGFIVFEMPGDRRLALPSIQDNETTGMTLGRIHHHSTYDAVSNAQMY